MNKKSVDKINDTTATDMNLLINSQKKKEIVVESLLENRFGLVTG